MAHPSPPRKSKYFPSPRHLKGREVFLCLSTKVSLVCSRGSLFHLTKVRAMMNEPEIGEIFRQCQWTENQQESNRIQHRDWRVKNGPLFIVLVQRAYPTLRYIELFQCWLFCVRCCHFHWNYFRWMWNGKTETKNVRECFAIDKLETRFGCNQWFWIHQQVAADESEWDESLWLFDDGVDDRLDAL